MKHLPTPGIVRGLMGLLLCASVSVGEKVEVPRVTEGVDFCVDIFTRRQGGYHTYRIPAMVVTTKGTVLLFCEGRKRSRRDSGDVDLIMKRSEDGGKTWSKQMLIHEQGGNAPICICNPCAIFERNDQKVHLFFTRRDGPCLFYTTSTDEGRTWSDIITFSDTPDQKEYEEDTFLKGFGGSPVTVWAGPVHGIQTRKGRLIAPSIVSRTGLPGGSCIIYSDDRGKTWSAGGVVPSVPGIGHGECTVVETSDGSLLMNMRGGSGYRVISTSADRGVTWSKPVLDKNLPEPGCQGSIIRLNEKEILFLNPAVHRAGGFHLWSRRNLTLRLSKDDGKTWPHSRVLRKGLAGYSDMAVTKDGKILCVFENGEGDYCVRMSIARVDREWILAGDPPEPEKEPQKK